MIHSYISRFKRAFLTDSLFRNASLLMASTAVMSVLGFGFWLFVAHLYKPSDIGVASALISITVLLSNLSLMGLNSGLIRFLPKSENKNGTINAALIAVGGATTLAATAYVLLGGHLGANMALLHQGWHKLLFVLLMSSIGLNSITDAVFIANRRAEFHTAAYALLGLVKLILPIGLVSLGPLGIFAAYIISMLVSLLFSLFLMTKWCEYSFFTKPDWHMLKQIRTYATNNYLAVVIAGLPSQLLPMFIIRYIGTAQVAFFSMAWTMANLLYIIPSATTQSLLAESSHRPEDKQYHLRHTIRILSLILLPAVLLAIFVAPYLLRIFGPEYSQHGTRIFQILALATFPYAFISVANTSLNIEHRSSSVIVTQTALSITTFASLVFLLRYGLTGVGIALLLGNIAACAAYIFLARRPPRHPKKPIKHLPTNKATIDLLLSKYDITDYQYEPLTNGSHNLTLRVDSGEQRYVLRVYQQSTQPTGQIMHELQFIEMLAAHNLPVPIAIANQDKQLLSRVTIGDTSWDYLLMHLIPGNHPSHYSANLLEAMARYQAQIHTLGSTFKPRTPSAATTKRPSVIQRTMQRLAWAQLKGYSHFDFDSTNILVKGEALNCILDFEGMRYGFLVGCLYFTLKRVYDSQHNLAQLKRYLQSYQTVRTLSHTEKLLLNGALLLHIRKVKAFFIA